MRRLGLLVPDPADPAYAERWRPVAARYADLFARHDVDLAPRPWTTPCEGAPAAIALLAWGYHFAPERWFERLATWPPEVRLLNPPPVLRWNTRKTYLAELARAGAPVVPTLAIARPDAAALADAFAWFGTAQIVVKPQLSAGAHLTARLRPGEAAPDGLRDALIQPYFPAVAAEGELSLFHFGGRFSHAVRMVAKGGDFRVQPQFGAALTAFDPDAETHAAAQAVLAAAAAVLPEPLTYARIDLIRAPDGRLALMELEAIEPDLYLQLALDGGDGFAAAVLDALSA